MMPAVAVIYLSYGVRPFLDDVLSCWEKIDYPRDRWEIIIVDNPSGDNSGELIREKVLPKANISLPKVTLITNKTNTGFAEGNNVAIKLALERGFDYVYLENNDAKFTPSALREVVALAESDEKIGSVQSLMLLWQSPEVINSTGGAVQFLGFGFVRENGQNLSRLSRQDGEEIAYASGAAVLYRAAALRKVGLLDSFLFLYHEDLELGWRLRLAGYKNVLSTKSLVYHHYEFKRSITKFFWMERNRVLVHFSHLKWRALFVLIPFLVGMEFVLLAFAIKGGWVKEKLKVYRAFLEPRTWHYVARKRKETRALRVVSDKEIIQLWTAKIEHQETANFVVEKIGNPILAIIWQLLKKIIVW